MPLRIERNKIYLEESCTVEDALPLVEFIQGQKNPKVDLSQCSYMHTAVLQALVGMRPKIAGVPNDPSLARWVMPLLARGDAEK